MPGYVTFDSVHTTHGRSVAFASGVKLANPELTVIVFAGDGDLVAIGGNHFIHTARRNIDIKVICINNFNYGMTGGQIGPTTPLKARGTTAPYGNFEPPFNIPHVADACGAVYVARWTTYHVRQLTKSCSEILKKKGFSVVEVIAPCPELYIRRNRLGTALDAMKYYKEKSIIKHGADTRELDIEFQGQIICGKFVDRERPDYTELMHEHFRSILGDKYVEYKGPPDWV
jgi:2-oxoglutarate ferredoxin oxidoreductase subunit beta